MYRLIFEESLVLIMRENSPVAEDTASTRGTSSSWTTAVKGCPSSVQGGSRKARFLGSRDDWNMLFPICWCGYTFQMYNSSVGAVTCLSWLTLPWRNYWFEWATQHFSALSEAWLECLVHTGASVEILSFSIVLAHIKHSSDSSLCLLQMSCHPELNQYIQDTLHCVKPLLEKVSLDWAKVLQVDLIESKRT